MSSSALLPIEGLALDNAHFTWAGKRHRYADVTALAMDATVTQTSVNGVPTGKLYQGQLVLEVRSGDRLTITPKKRLLRSGSKEADFRGFQVAAAVLMEMTFPYRLKSYERSVTNRSFFSVGEYKVHTSGDVFLAKKKLASLTDGDWKVAADFAQVTSTYIPRNIKERLGSWMSPKSVSLSLRWDRDCILYMLANHVGIRFSDMPAPELRVDRHELFYITVLRFGARLAMADGKATSDELLQLKAFFDIDSDTVENAGAIYNAALNNRESIGSILAEFRREFMDTPEIFETFLTGMASVSLADGFLHPLEVDLLSQGAVALGMDRSSVTRAFRNLGGEWNFQDEGPSDEAGSERPRSGKSAMACERFDILGVAYTATQSEIRAAYTSLVRRYHPDRLVNNGLPPGELKRSEALLAEINVAYGWLREHGHA